MNVPTDVPTLRQLVALEYDLAVAACQDGELAGLAAACPLPGMAALAKELRDLRRRRRLLLSRLADIIAAAQRREVPS
jgi:hypothetical protein